MDEIIEQPLPDRGGVDLKLLGIYLNDHLAGSVAGARRMSRTAEVLARTPVGPGIGRVVEQVEQEQEVLRRVLQQIGATQALPKQLMTAVAEAVGRLKLNGRLVRPSPMTPLLEVELLRAAVVGKLGLWQTLRELAPSLGLDDDELRRLLEQTHEQIRTLDEVHAYVRTRALRQRSPHPGVG